MTPRALLVCAAVGLGACGKPADSTRPDPVAAPAAPAAPGRSPGAGSSNPTGAPTMPSPLAVKLLASPTQLTMAQRPKFMVGVEVTNRGPTPVDPQLSTGCRLTVNGQPSMAWNLAIGNGAREASWYAVPPGQTATMSWPLGAELFDQPGDYHLVLTLGGQQATADIHVTR